MLHILGRLGPGIDRFITIYKDLLRNSFAEI